MANCPIETKREIRLVANSLRHFMRDKPIDIRFATTNVIYGLIAIARGRTSPHLYAALGENIRRMGGGR